jgi:hypothetical protein
MTQIQILNMLNDRINNLKQDKKVLSSGVHKIIVEHLIDELYLLIWSIENPHIEIYTSTGFKVKQSF